MISPAELQIGDETVQAKCFAGYVECSCLRVQEYIGRCNFISVVHLCLFTLAHLHSIHWHSIIFSFCVRFQSPAHGHLPHPLESLLSDHLAAPLLRERHNSQQFPLAMGASCGPGGCHDTNDAGTDGVGSSSAMTAQPLLFKSNYGVWTVGHRTTCVYIYIYHHQSVCLL